MSFRNEQASMSQSMIDPMSKSRMSLIKMKGAAEHGESKTTLKSKKQPLTSESDNYKLA